MGLRLAEERGWEQGDTGSSLDRTRTPQRDLSLVVSPHTSHLRPGFTKVFIPICSKEPPLPCMYPKALQTLTTTRHIKVEGDN